MMGKVWLDELNQVVVVQTQRIWETEIVPSHKIRSYIHKVSLM